LVSVSRGAATRGHAKIFRDFKFVVATSSGAAQLPRQKGEIDSIRRGPGRKTHRHIRPLNLTTAIAEPAFAQRDIGP